ncbi:DoxX family protein [Curtobacterium sp. Leaf261]|uniref:DoxX family protein n=1 Tax=Curtobacterium sp. Leaf261 TaxID=1736311 RepID=UPI0006FA1DC8|nr:hypothetical protein [Curtobacterium sp. Leaf261]KQO63525.1 hypothetical protein ASF23_04575 [Curtobacterium sp. Leaf261]
MQPVSRFEILRTIGQALLGAVLLFTGTVHLTVGRESFRAQVPPWVPLPVDTVVVLSGIAELVLGLALVLVWKRPARNVVGWLVALFFVVIFPGNIAQLVDHRSTFGLSSDTARAVRLVFQPILVLWALWATGAWRAWREHRRARRVSAA